MMKEGGAVLLVVSSICAALALSRFVCLLYEASLKVEGGRLEELKRYGLRRR